MKKNIDLIIDGIAPEKVMYDTDNHSLVVLYPAQREFKRGDIVFEDGRIIIVKNMPSDYSMLYYQLSNSIKVNGRYGVPFSASTVRLATPKEAQKLFDALAKEGKKWNAETLEIEELDISEIVVDLESACEYLKKSKPIFSGFYMNYEDENKWEAQITLQLICEAWNKFDGFVVDWSNDDQDKYYPLLNKEGDIDYLITDEYKHISSSCYSFPTKERAIQFGTQFKLLFRTALGM